MFRRKLSVDNSIFDISKSLVILVEKIFSQVDF